MRRLRAAVVVSSPSEFASAVAAYSAPDVILDGDVIGAARASIVAAGLLVVGEQHGIHETPSVLYALAQKLETRAVAFEWSYEEVDGPMQDFLRTGELDFERLWSLPRSSEFFCGDGRFAAGTFRLLQRLRGEGRLDQVIAYDRLDPEPAPADWRSRDREMAERLLGEWDDRLPLLLLTGAFHAQLEPAHSDTMATHLARARPGLEAAMVSYTAGQCWWRGEIRDVSPAVPESSISIRLPAATPAIVPGPFA
jgi:hypothetical protein